MMEGDAPFIIPFVKYEAFTAMLLNLSERDLSVVLAVKLIAEEKSLSDGIPQDDKNKRRIIGITESFLIKSSFDFACQVL
ncbi:MAG: hypothetical protein ACI4NM_04260 [Bullifex sp.]